mmetsp:Transcript_1484/g.223  ORF Transcript_1484/g.223 Transcript_1484/m.223 type:complete len:88 (-) Transcript_1484:747-1010(-)
MFFFVLFVFRYVVSIFLDFLFFNSLLFFEICFFFFQSLYSDLHFFDKVGGSNFKIRKLLNNGEVMSQLLRFLRFNNNFLFTFFGLSL